MAEECKVYEIRVPDAATYYSRFVDKYVGASPARENEVVALWYLAREAGGAPGRLGQLGRGAPGPGRYEAYIKAYCAAKGYRTALLLYDGGDEDWWYVVFGLDEDTINRIRDEVEGYVDAVERALDAMPEGEARSEFEGRCYRLEGGDPRECLEEARRILSERRALPA